MVLVRKNSKCFSRLLIRLIFKGKRYAVFSANVGKIFFCFGPFVAMLNNTMIYCLNFSLHFFVPLQKNIPMKVSENPTYQSFTLSGVMHISPFAAAESIANGNALIVDVREQEEIDIIKLDVDNQIHMPLTVIAERFKELPANTTLIVICSNGNRSVKVVNLLNYQGYKEAVNLDGGINQWYRDGLPLILRQDILDSTEGCGSGKSGGCGCSCGC